MIKLLQRLRVSIQSLKACNARYFCSHNETFHTKAEEKEALKKEVEIPEEPTNCCQSGCANCVYIEYAQKLMEDFECGGEKAQKIILEKIKDPSMKAFLEMELRMKLKPK